MNHILRNSSRLTLSRSVVRMTPGVKVAPMAFGSNGPMYVSRRHNSDNVDKSVPVESIPTVDTSVVDTSSVSDALTAAVVNTPEKVNMISEFAMSGIDWIHTTMDIPYWGAIIAGTVILRIALLPVAIKTIKSSAAMAIVRPHLQKISDRMAADTDKDAQAQVKYQREMQALMKKYDVNPFRAMLWPLSQFPVFIGAFIALREMGSHYPDFITGGTGWFANLSIADPTLILPIMNAASFLAMIEMGSDGINVQQQGQFKNIMRGLAVVMVPLTMDMPAGLFVYWVTNNCLSLVQTQALKNEKLRVMLNIPKPPPVEDQPALKMSNPFTRLKDAVEGYNEKQSRTKAEILDGVVAPPGPPSTPPPATFSMPPRARKPAAKQ